MMLGHGRPVLVATISLLVSNTAKCFAAICFSIPRSRLSKLCMVLLGIALLQVAAPGSFTLSPSGNLANAQEFLIQEPIFPEWFADTPLNDVAFLDDQNGVAIGDRGLILHTSDGGQTWQQKRTAINCKLSSLCFVDQQHGYIVGGYDIPNYSRSKGVLLRTSDGGLSWKLMQNQILPRLRWCNFTTANHGWVIGESSPSHPSGILETQDGGVTWSSLSGSSFAQVSSETDPNWLTASNLGETLVLASTKAKSFLFEQGEFNKSVFNATRPFTFQCIEMLDDRIGFAVGNCGAIAQTKNGGLSWNAVENSDPNYPNNIDLSTVVKTDKGILVAGNPGSYFYHYDLQTQTWARYRTGTSVNINSISFSDPQNGWAVGAMGTILRTDDGGENWHVQRGGNNKLAILQFAETPQDCNLEFIAKYATENNLHCGVCILYPGDNFDKSVQALMRLGVSQVITPCDLDQFTSQKFTSQKLAGQEANRRQTAGDQTADTRLKLVEEFIIQQIRIHQPQVVTLQSSDNGMVARFANAVQESRDGQRYPHQILEQGLNAAEVPVALRITHDQSTDGKISRDQFFTRLGRRLEDHVAISRGLMNQPVLQDGPIGLSVIDSRLGRRNSFSDLESVLNDAGLQIARRRVNSPPLGNLSMMRSAGKKDTRIQQMLDFDLPQFGQRNWVTGINETIIGLDPLTGGTWLHELKEKYIAIGKPDLAAETVAYFSRSYPDHPLLYGDLLWLWKFYASDEFANIQVVQSTTEDRLMDAVDRQYRPGQTVQQVEQVGGTTKMIWKPVKPETKPDADLVEQASYEKTLEVKKELTDQIVKNRRMQSQRIAIALSRLDFDAFQEPEIKFASLRLEERLKSAINSTGQLKVLADDPNSNLSQFASVELSLLAEKSLRGVPVIKCMNFEERPELNGILDDKIWQRKSALDVIRIPNQMEAGNLDEIVISRDDKFLYLGIQCQKLQSRKYLFNEAIRDRDEYLENEDRMIVRIDTDRDYQSWFQLTIDWQGRLAEHCGDSPGWNPQWFVARRHTDTHWIIEAAIPLAELTFQVDDPGVWAISFTRMAGDQQIGMWPIQNGATKASSFPSTTRNVLTRFGYLQFGSPEE